MTETYHETLFNGESRTLDVTVTSAGEPMDLSGGSATWVLIDGDGTEHLRKENGGDITLTDPANGELTVAISTTETSGLDPERYQHYLRVTDTNGNVAVVLDGDLLIRESPF